MLVLLKPLVVCYSVLRSSALRHCDPVKRDRPVMQETLEEPEVLSRVFSVGVPVIPSSLPSSTKEAGASATTVA